MPPPLESRELLARVMVISNNFDCSTVVDVVQYASLYNLSDLSI